MEDNEVDSQDTTVTDIGLSAASNNNVTDDIANDDRRSYNPQSKW